MSSSKLISGDELSDYQRWELPSVQSASDKRPRVEDVDTDVATKPLTADEVERIHEEAYREGFAQGLNEGRAAGTSDIETTVGRLIGIIDALAQPLADVDETVTQELVALALAIAQQIIRREIKTEPGEVVAIVQQALTTLPAASRHIQIFVHPDDAKLLRDSAAMPAGGERHWQVIDEPMISRGGCKISTDHSQIDATVESRIANIAVKLLGGERQEDSDDYS